MRIGHLAVTGLFAIALGGRASANGRDPYASTINFEPGNSANIMAGMTFGLLRSQDGGATWQWYCEKTVGYGGTYDPDYAYSATGSVFATTFDGLRVMRDGCAFTATEPGMTFVSRVERAANGDLYFTAADPTDSKIYKSTDDGVTFPPGSAKDLGKPNDWWQSIMIAGDSQHVYVSGYRSPLKCTTNTAYPGALCQRDIDCFHINTGDSPDVQPGRRMAAAPGAGGCEPQKEFFMFTSTDAGANYSPMTMSGITPTSLNSAIDIVGIDPSNPLIVYARVTLETATSGDSIYKSTDGGQTWTKILSKSSNIGSLAFLVRGDGSCVAGTRDIGSWKSSGGSSGCGTTWTDLVGAPHIGCLYRNPANDEVWACTQNVASPQLNLTSDGYGIMKTADLATWTGVLRFEDIKQPVSCGAGSVQEDQCVQRYHDMSSPWCCLTTQLGIDSLVVDCNGDLQCFRMAEPSVDAGTTMVKPEPGCFGCGASGGPSAGLTLLVGSLLFRRRRRCR